MDPPRIPPHFFLLRDLGRARLRKLRLDTKNFTLCQKASLHVLDTSVIYAHVSGLDEIRAAVPSRGPNRGIFRDQPAPTNHNIGFGAPERRPWLGPRGLTNAFPRPNDRLHGSGGLGHSCLPSNLLRETLTNPGWNHQIARSRPREVKGSR